MVQKNKIKKETVTLDEPKKEINAIPKEYVGLIMVKKSPIFRPERGVPMDSVRHLDDEIVAVDPNDKRVEVMLRNGNLQFVSNQIRTAPTGEYPRIVED